MYVKFNWQETQMNQVMFFYILFWVKQSKENIYKTERDVTYKMR